MTAPSSIPPLHYVEAGQGRKTAILIHGFPMTSALWHKVAPLLEDNIRLIMPDLRGFGGSAVKGSLHLNFETLADDIARLMDNLDIAQAHIVGASLGAMVSMVFAHRHQSRTQSLVIFHSEADPDDEEAKLTRNSQIKFVRNQGAKGFARHFAKRILGRSAKAEDLEFLSDMMSQASARAMIAGLRLLRDRSDLRLLLPNITTPALIVAGAEDPHSPPHVMEKTADLFSNGQFHIMDGVRHLSAIECPQSAAKIVRDWVLTHS